MLGIPDPLVRPYEPDQDVFEDVGGEKEAGKQVHNK